MDLFVLQSILVGQGDVRRNMTLCRRQLDIKMHHPKHVHFKGQWHWGVFSGHSPKDSSRNSRHVPKMIPRRLPAG